MKVIFKHSKALGNSSAGDEKEMFSTTAAVLHRKGFGSITKKITSVKQGANGVEKKYAELTKEEKASLKLDESLVSKVKEVKEDKD